MKPRFLVTGAAGFVGRQLCMELIRRQFIVTGAMRDVLADTKTRYPLVPIADIGPQTDWTVALHEIDVVIHLAARVHVMFDSAENAMDEFYRVNVAGTQRLAKSAASSGVKRLVYVSSIKVNGEQTKVERAFNELDEANAHDAYAISKWKAEQALQEIAADTGMEIVIVRPPLVYGPGVKANFSTLLRLVNSGIPLPFGCVKNSRSLVYSGNLVDALITCAMHPAAAGQTYLVSDNEDVSTPQLINAVAAGLYRPSRIIPVPVALLYAMAKLIGKSAAFDRLTQSLVIDSSKIRNELNWQPPYSMTQGLRATIDWYSQAAQTVSQ